MNLRTIAALAAIGIATASFAQSSRYPSPGGGGSGTVTSITAGTGLTGGTITTSGTVALSTPVSTANGGTNASTWTAGSIPYLSSSTAFGQDNANFSWDGTDHFLGIGTASPAAPLDLESALTVASATGAAMQVEPTIMAHANNDNPAGLFVQPTWATGSHSGVIATAARFRAISSVVATTALELDTDGNYGVLLEAYKGASMGPSAEEDWRVEKDGRMYNDGEGNGSANFPNYGSLADLNSGMFISPGHVGFSSNSVERFSVTNNGLVLGAASTTQTHQLNTATATTGSGVLTLTNAPTGVSGDPAGYISITINGSSHYIPFW